MMHRPFLLKLVAAISISIVIVTLPSTGNAQSACTPREVDLIVQGLQVMMQAYLNNDVETLVSVAQYVDNNLSPTCLNALSSLSAAAQQQGGGNSTGRSAPPTVYNHGGGTYSVPGIGACGPSGCVAY